MTQDVLNVAVFQLDLVWENSVSNRTKIDQWLQKTGADKDVVFFPEMFSTGFTMNACRFAEPMDGETISWMKCRSREYQIALCGSLIICEGEHIFNRLVFIEPSGNVYFYDKRHLFTMVVENLNFQKGSERLVVTYKGWRICPLICYDLRFPVWSRNQNEYDILVYSANWPQSRSEVWNTLLCARAIENQSFVVGVNRVGSDGNLIAYSGNSKLINPKGQILAEQENCVEGIISSSFSYRELIHFRSTVPVLDDADLFLLSQ